MGLARPANEFACQIRRIFIWEYCCDACRDAPESLRREGRAMRSAILADFARCPDVEAVTIPDRLPIDDEPATFRRLAHDCDWTLAIAPETENVLYERCQMVETSGGRLLGSDSAAVRLTGDKLELALHLAKHGVPTPRCESDGPPSLPFPLVCKPRDGAGSQATFLIRDRDALACCVEKSRAEGYHGEMIVQSFVPGQAVSVAVLTGPSGNRSLPAAEQHLSDDGRFRYLGGRLPLVPDLDARARRLAERATGHVTGLLGYVGVDLVLGERADDDVVMEINPRLTTSYLGLRRLAEDNLAGAMLALAQGEEVPVLRWRAETIAFSCR